MSNKIVVLCLLIFCILDLSAQEETVTKIRKAYTDYNTQIEKYKAEKLEFLPARYEIKTVQNRPALGPVQMNFAYYFDETTKEDLSEETNYPTSQGLLRKVVYTESMPSYTDYREFFYDENGNLLFYYSRLTGSDCGEKRFYFDKGKLIKLKFNPIIEKDCGNDKFPDFTRSTGKFTKEDLDWEKWIIKTAGFHSKAFLNMFEASQ